MRTEYKEITIKQEIYIADDGKEFIDEGDCIDYEFMILGQQIECYDADGTKINDPERCSAVNLQTEDDVKRFIQWSDLCGCTTDGIDKPGIYVYGCGDEWVNIDDLISRIRGEKKEATDDDRTKT